jgi:hypothetical protein
VDGASEERDIERRLDEHQKKRFEAVEFVVEKNLWNPQVPRRKENKRVRVRVALPEVELCTQVKCAEGR